MGSDSSFDWYWAPGADGLGWHWDLVLMGSDYIGNRALMGWYKLIIITIVMVFEGGKEEHACGLSYFHSEVEQRPP